MTPEERQKLESELAALKMDLTFSNECGNHLVCNYIAQKEAGETPTININTINQKRKVIVERMKEIEDELAKN